MLRNYLLIALRTIRRNKLNSFIKISGLALGISSCMVVYLIVSFQLSFDTSQPGRDKIYRIYTRFSGTFEGANRGVPTALPATVASEFSGLEAVTHFQTWSANVQVKGSTTKTFEDQDRIIITGPEYFDVFQIHQWVASSATVLKQPFTVVLTEKKAHLYFGPGSVAAFIGRELIYQDSLSVSVAGIVKDIDANTDFDFEEYISYSTISQSFLKNNFRPDDWSSVNSSSQCFIRITKGISIETTTTNMPLLEQRYLEHNKDMHGRVNFERQT